MATSRSIWEGGRPAQFSVPEAAVGTEDARGGRGYRVAPGDSCSQKCAIWVPALLAGGEARLGWGRRQHNFCRRKSDAGQEMDLEGEEARGGEEGRGSEEDWNNGQRRVTHLTRTRSREVGGSPGAGCARGGGLAPVGAVGATGAPPGRRTGRGRATRRRPWPCPSAPPPSLFLFPCGSPTLWTAWLVWIVCEARRGAWRQQLRRPPQPSTLVTRMRPSVVPWSAEPCTVCPNRNSQRRWCVKLTTPKTTRTTVYQPHHIYSCLGTAAPTFKFGHFRDTAAILRLRPG